MPRVVREPEMMDIDEPVVLEPVAPELVEPSVEPEEEEEGYEEMITLRAADFYALQDTLDDIRS
jgi:hypothetical protein